MHLSRFDIERYHEDLLEPARRQDAESHLADCEFCREILSEYRVFTESVASVGDAEIEQVVGGLDVGRNSSVIPLRPLTSSAEPVEHYLAADGDKEVLHGIECLTSLVSEEPQLVLRVMRDHDANSDFLQLIADDPSIVSHVLIQVPELDREFLTDTSGRVELSSGLEKEYNTVNWQIRMPEAVFDLQPLLSKPKGTSERKEVTLSTNQGDQIVVTFEPGKAADSLAIEVKSIRGSHDYGPLRAYVSTNSERSVSDIKPNSLIYVGPVTGNSIVILSLFR